MQICEKTLGILFEMVWMGKSSSISESEANVKGRPRIVLLVCSLDYVNCIPIDEDWAGHGFLVLLAEMDM